MISLSDDELNAILLAAGSIPVEHRDAFLRGVADQLAHCAVLGPGIIHRTVISLQRKYYEPVDTSGLRLNKYARGH